MRNEFYRKNGILKKEMFTYEDEINIEKWLTRTKHSLLINRKTFMPTENFVKWNNQASKFINDQSEYDYEKFLYFYSNA